MIGFKQKPEIAITATLARADQNLHWLGRQGDSSLIPRVSILLPVYNGSRFLAEQVDSIVAQRFADWELLICDDGSSDDTRAHADQFARRDQRVTLLPSTGNQGQRARLVQLLSIARAPLIAISDQDDVWHPDKLALLHDALDDRALAFGSSHLIDDRGAPLGKSLADHTGSPPNDGDRLRYLFDPYVSAHAALIRRTAISSMAFNRFAHFDWLISLDAAFGAGIVHVDNAIVYHRLHGGNQVNGAMARRASTWRLAPELLYRELQSTRQRRNSFVEQLEHIAFSPVVDEDARRMAAQVGPLCRGSWFEPGLSRPFDNPGLRHTLFDALAPFAGSREDWRVAVDRVTEVTQAQFHPRTIARMTRRLLG